MFSRFKTSTRISIKFMIFTTITILVFGMIVNIIFFQLWYGMSMQRLLHIPGDLSQHIMMGSHMIQPRRSAIQEFAPFDHEIRFLQQHRVFRNISRVDHSYFLWVDVVRARDEHVLRVVPVTEFAELQILLIQVTGLLLLGFGAGAYLIGLLFVRNSLRGLQTLVGYAQQMSIDHDPRPLNLIGPKDDELKILSETLFASLQQIHHHTLSLKDFIGHASHEIKTPLMAMSSELDYLKRAGKCEDIAPLKGYIETMKRLIEQLLLITRLEHMTMVEKSYVKVSQILKHSIDMMTKKYADADVHRELDIVDTIQLRCHASSWEMIVQNLLDNAIKYNRLHGTVRVILNEDVLVIEDTGKGIDVKHLKHIRERFRQADASKSDTTSFGLGLYLVKKLVDLHGWTMEVTSQVGNGTKVVVNFESHA